MLDHAGMIDHAGPALVQEQAWRRPGETEMFLQGQGSIVATRWVDPATSCRRGAAETPPDRHVIGVALQTTRLRLTRGTLNVFEGIMHAGMVHVTGPSQRLEAEFSAPCDFIHFYVSNDFVLQRQAAALAHIDHPVRDLNDLVIRDPLIEQLGRSLVDGGNAWDGQYADHIGRTVVMRLVALRPPAPRVRALSKWRLRRVREHIDAHLSDTVTLADLAVACGLSRMHFAAQFRAATGCRPHEYLLQRRIEAAQTLLMERRMSLAEIALNVGFQTQSHFSTVFKRFTGDTPARWRQAVLDGASGQPAVASAEALYVPVTRHR